MVINHQATLHLMGEASWSPFQLFSAARSPVEPSMTPYGDSNK